MKISLVIPAYNEEKYIGTCLKSVEKYGQDFFEVIVVDNASTDKTAEIAKDFSFVRVVHESKKGVSWARQKGYEEAKGDFLAYIDADCQLHARWYEMILDEFSKDRNLVSLSGPPHYYDIPFLKNILARMFWWLTAPISYRLTGYMMSAANFCLKKEVLEKINGFNTSIVFHGDDTNLASRLSPYGKVKYRMDFFIYTSGRRIAKEGLLKSYIIYGVNFLWQVFFKKSFNQNYADHR